MVSLASTQSVEHSHISAVLSDHPALAIQTIRALAFPPMPSDYSPTRLEAHFNSKLVLLLESGQITYEAQSFSPDYRPKVLAIYGDSELLFVRVGPEVLVNRLPLTYTPAWKTYASE